MTQELQQINQSTGVSEVEDFSNKMMSVYKDTFDFAKKLLAKENELPAVVDNDTDSGSLGDYIKQIKSCEKSIDALRTEEKEVYLKGSRMVDGFFNRYREDLKKVMEKAARVQGEYLQKKKDEEARRRQEEADKKREEAEAAMREAEQKRKEAEEKRKAAEDEAKKAAEEAAKRQKEIEDKAAEDKRVADAEIARLRAEDDKNKQAIKDAEEKAKQIDRDAKAELKEVRQELKASEDTVNDLNKLAKQDERESNKLIDVACRADKQAEKFDKLANTNAADMARTRGLEGSVSTVRTDWVGTVTDRNELDLEALRYHFTIDDMQKALNSWVKANPGKQLKGAYVSEEHKAIVR